MKDEEKTKEQLISELEEMRKQIAKLEAPEAGHKQAETIPAVAEENYRWLFELTPIGVTMLDMKGVILYCNSAVYNKGGYTKGEFTGKHFSKIASVRVKDIPTYIRIFNSIVRGEIPQSFEVNYRRKDGTPGWTELSIGLVKIGRKRRILVMQHDITERKQIEAELKESERRYRQLFEGVNDGIMVLGSNGKFIDCNETTLQYLGYGREELLRLTAADIVHPDFHELMKENQKKIWSGESVVFESIHRTKDGREIPVEASARKIMYQEEPVIIGMVRDITERKQAEEALRESHNYLESLTNSMGDAVFSVRMPERVIEWVNDGFKVFGYDADECVGKTTVFLYPNKSEFLDFGNKLKKAMAAGKQILYAEQLLIRKNGEVFPAEVTVTFHKEKGEVVYVTSIVRDITERKQMEEQIQLQSEIVANMAEGVLLTRASDRMIVYANSRFEGMFGYGQGELIGKHVSILNAPSERAPEEVAEEIVKQLDENGEWSGEVHNIKKDGTCFWSRAKIVEFEHPVHGKVDVNVLEDVTERRNAEVALRQSEERLRILIESAEDIIIMQDKDGKYLYYNGAPRYGIGTGDVVGKKPFDIFEPSIAERIINQTKEVLESGQSKTSENQVPWQGEILWFSDQVSPVEDDTGNIVATVTISRNITEHKKMEETLLKSEERWRSLVTSAPNIIMLVDGDGTIHFINQTVSGIEPKDVIGKKSLYEYIEPEYHDVVRKTTNEVFNTGKLGSYEIRGVGPDGTTSWYQTKVGPVKDGQRIVALILISSDVTEHKQVEEERQRAAKLESIGTLAGGIAHDFNNLLTGIMGNIGLAKRYMEPKGKAFERLEEAEKASIRARDLTQQLLTFARGGAPIKKLTAIAGLVKESITLALSGSNVMSDFSIPDDLWPIEIDEVQINQALSNITINAVQAMPNGGIISIRTSNLVINKKTTLPLSNGNYVEIAIADHGTGIPKEHLSRMFEPYFTTKQKGSGLGLATAYSIIKNHNGHIAVKSTISVGTTVHIYLPAVKERAPKMKEQEEQPALIGQGRVLVMDDEETIRDFLYAELTEVGYEVELTSDGAKAIERYMGAKEAGKPFDAVILDLTIPGGMGGKEAIKKLLEIDPDVKAIVSSGYATDPIMSDYKKYGFSAVVTKPYSVEQLEKTLQGLLRKKK